MICCEGISGIGNRNFWQKEDISIRKCWQSIAFKFKLDVKQLKKCVVGGVWTGFKKNKVNKISQFTSYVGLVRSGVLVLELGFKKIRVGKLKALDWK